MTRKNREFARASYGEATSAVKDGGEVLAPRKVLPAGAAPTGHALEA
jgi:hypothetical protein